MNSNQPPELPEEVCPYCRADFPAGQACRACGVAEATSALNSARTKRDRAHSFLGVLFAVANAMSHKYAHAVGDNNSDSSWKAWRWMKGSALAWWAVREDFEKSFPEGGGDPAGKELAAFFNSFAIPEAVDSDFQGVAKPKIEQTRRLLVTWAVDDCGALPHAVSCV